MDGTPRPKRWPGRVLRLDQRLPSGGWTSRPRTPGPPIRLPTPPISRVRSTTWPSTGPPASACTRPRLNGTPSPARRLALRQPRTGSLERPAPSRHPRCAAPHSPVVPSNSFNIPPASSTATRPVTAGLARPTPSGQRLKAHGHGEFAAGRLRREGYGSRPCEGLQLRPAEPERKVVVDEQEDEEGDDYNRHDHHRDHHLQGGVAFPGVASAAVLPVTHGVVLRAGPPASLS